MCVCVHNCVCACGLVRNVNAAFHPNVQETCAFVSAKLKAGAPRGLLFVFINILTGYQDG